MPLRGCTGQLHVDVGELRGNGRTLPLRESGVLAELMPGVLAFIFALALALVLPPAVVLAFPPAVA